MIWHVFTNFKSMKPSTFTCFKSKHIVVEPGMLPNYKVDLSKEKNKQNKTENVPKDVISRLCIKVVPKNKSFGFCISDKT